MSLTIYFLNLKTNIVLILLFLTPVFLKGQIKSQNSFEINCGIELYRNVAVGGAGYNLNISKNFVFLPAVDLIGAVIISGSLKFPIRFSKKLNVYPKFGLGFLPVGFLISTAWITGLGVKYSISRKTNLFIETKLVFISGDVVSIGSSTFQKRNIKDFPPLVLVVGWEI